MATKLIATSARAVVRKDVTFLVASTNHKQPRVYVHRKRYPGTNGKRAAQDVASRLRPNTTLTPDSWVRIDPVALAMTGSIKAI